MGFQRQAMKYPIIHILLLALLPVFVSAEELKPYILAGIDQGSLEESQTSIIAQLAVQEFEVLGSYSPADDDTLGVICVTHELLKEAATEAGGLLGFASVLRVGLHATPDGTVVSYMNPQYWGNAYFREDFPKVEDSYATLEKKLHEALADLGESRFEPFGSKKGKSEKKLRKYHYMMAMPFFDDVVELNSDTPYDDSIECIESRTAAEDSEVEIVYSLKFPERKMALYGVALTGAKGEVKFLPKIDFKEPRHVPFLPYEILVLEDKVVMLHGKYRIALSFPDLSMGTFMKISSTPGDIADALRVIAEDK